MHVAFTEANKNGDKDLISTIESSLVLMVRRDPANPLVIHMVTSMPGQNGMFTAHQIRESPEEMSRRVNIASAATLAIPTGSGMPSRDSLGFPKDN
jgi:hypothetical protein